MSNQAKKGSRLKELLAKRKNEAKQSLDKQEDLRRQQEIEEDLRE